MVGTKTTEGNTETPWDIPFVEGRTASHRKQRVMTTVLGGLLLIMITVAGGCVSSPRGPIERAKTKPGGVYHTVKRHQTLWRICKTYNVDMAEVARINGIRDVNRIQAGQRVFIPGAERVLPVDIYIEDLGPIGKKPAKVDLAKVKDRFIWPLRGDILRGFGVNQGRKHDGVDISAPQETPIKSIDAGTVLYSGNEIRGYGNIVIIKHGPVFTSVYAHNAVNLVREGDRVKKGHVIARVGRTGRGMDPYLHFEIRNHNRPIDPLSVLP
jgi:lipoprotein NlpD